MVKPASGWSLGRVVAQHLLKEVKTVFVKGGDDDGERLAWVNGEVFLKIGELLDAGPVCFGGGAQRSKYAVELVGHRGAREEGVACRHLCEDASGAPDVDGGPILAGAHEDVWGSVPEGDDFVGVVADGGAEGAGQTKVREFELAFFVDQEVLGLQISVQDAVVVAEGHALEELPEEGFDGGARDVAAERVDVLFQVLVEVLEDQGQLLLGVDHVVQSDDVGVLELLEKRDLTDRGARDSFVLTLQTDALQRHDLS